MAFSLKKNGEVNTLYQNDFSNRDLEKAGYSYEHFDLDLPHGHMKWQQWLFDGIRISYSENDFYEDAELDWAGDVEMVTMFFNLKGKISITNTDTGVPYELTGNHHNIFYSKHAEGRMNVEELKTNFFMVQLSKDAFLKISKHGHENIQRFSENISAGRSLAFSEQSLPIDLSIQHCIQSILKCPYGDSLKRMFLLSKSIEMLVLQADAFDKKLSASTSFLKSEYDKERIIYARDYLVKHMDAPPTLTELSHIAGINEFKLKKGFKETFHQTVFQYLAEVRLELAKQELLDGKKSMSDIAFELGYSSVQHFSAAFRKKFEVPPGRFKK